jgi:phage protein D
MLLFFRRGGYKMVEQINSRRAKLNVQLLGYDVSDDINNRLISFDYTDNLSGQLDDIKLTFSDFDKKWLNNYLNSDKLKNTIITAKIVNENYDGFRKNAELYCGEFTIDEISYSFYPSIISLAATSAPFSNNFRSSLKNRTYANIKLSVLAAQIAQNASMTFKKMFGFDPLFEQLVQSAQTDLNFLYNVCSEQGLFLKLFGNTILIYETAANSLVPAFEIRNNAGLISASFSDNLNNTAYDSCRVFYEKNGQKIEYTYKPRNPPGTGLTLEINEKVNDREEAHQLAIRRYRQKNSLEKQAEISLVGNAQIVAGSRAHAVNFGYFSGFYIVSRAVHSVSNSGYITQISLAKEENQ